MLLQDRINYFNRMFDLLKSTNSRSEKEYIVSTVLPEYKEDFEYILECLAGKHKFGYKYYYTKPVDIGSPMALSIKQMLMFLQKPMEYKDLRESTIQSFVELTTQWYDFFEPIVNRTLRLGIGQSLLEKDALSPMLAKKFDGTVKYDKDGYYITEKLDGNRCIAHHDGTRWKFTSRNGKEMHVDFNMEGLDESLVYDGEILSPKQLQLSLAVEDKVKYGVDPGVKFDDQFSSTSGLINKHNKDKALVYNIFDIMYDAPYKERRAELDKMTPKSENVRILPVLKYCKNNDELQDAWDILNQVTDLGGEGIMINTGSATYLHKRTDQLLKLKKVYTMDMKVYGIEEGTGKYEGFVGALDAMIKTDDGKTIICSVGTGLSDAQRVYWAANPDKIIGKIIEVSYFSLSQSKDAVGSNVYSLRFPRLKAVRNDKDETSEY